MARQVRTLSSKTLLHTRVPFEMLSHVAQLMPRMNDLVTLDSFNDTSHVDYALYGK